MKEILTTILISLVVSVAVLFSLGPTMLKLNAPETTTLIPSTASKGQAEAPAPLKDKVPEVEATAPNVMGMQIQAARDQWRAQGILIIEDATRVDATTEPGTILSQTPIAGATLKQKEIRAVVASAPEMVDVPNVIGEPVDKAVKMLSDAGFEVPPPTRERTEGKPGSVIKQEPEAGNASVKGSVVRITAVEELIEVPKLYGKRIDQAKKKLEDLGLALGKVSEREDEEMSGRRVLSQSPAAGSTLSPGETVDLVIVAPD